MEVFNKVFFEKCKEHDEELKTMMKEYLRTSLNEDFNTHHSSILIFTPASQKEYLDKMFKNHRSYIINYFGECGGNYDCIKERLNRDFLQFLKRKEKTPINWDNYSFNPSIGEGDSFFKPPKTDKEKENASSGHRVYHDKNISKFIMNVMSENLSEGFFYNPKFSKKGLKRFTKKINDRFHIAFSYNAKIMKAELQKAMVGIPRFYIELIDTSIPRDIDSVILDTNQENDEFGIKNIFLKYGYFFDSLELSVKHERDTEELTKKKITFYIENIMLLYNFYLSFYEKVFIESLQVLELY
ncbi:hypothetical protein [Flammeovirga sp. SJP92]|uniref:hypothetical protein n=1 Tax=Flammeovirga sp. SJP92 TaxID=1775430 RepID=UPI000786EBA6|nr:hypothetical protein [Flammeovirga sp. SJP92]KXX72225.1 hypothetical protein AVL50_01085 [Flammeovirga sp. SJP92]